jgi:putative ABC transport system permease protein
MIKLALRGIRASIGRLILTTIAIVAGVGFVSGSFILADSLTETFDDLFTGAVEGVDGQIRLAELDFGTLDRTIPASLSDEVDALDEVGQANPVVSYGDETAMAPFAILDEDGEKIIPPGPPVVTFSWDGESNGLFTVADGEPPAGIDETVISSEYAAQADVSVGETVEMATPDGTREFLISGIVEFKATGGAWFVLFDFESGQILYDKEGEVDLIDLSRAPGVSTEDMIAAVTEVLPDGVEVIDQSEVIEQSSAEFEQIIGFLRNGLLGFALVALFVSLFIIYNTFSILVAQRLHQIGMLRAVGATKAQIRRSVVIEALAVGVIGSLLGLGLGIALAVLIKAAFQAGGVFPPTATIIAPRTIIIAFIVGIGATRISALLPAFLAGRITPIAAMRNEPPPRASRNRRIAAGSVVLGIGLVLMGVGLFGSGQEVSMVVTELGAGAVFTFVGVAMLSGLFAGPVVSLIGQPEVLGASLLGLGVLLPVLTFTIGDGAPDGVLSGISFTFKMGVSVVAAVTGLSILATAVRGGRATGLGGSAAGLEGRLARQNASRSPQRTAATATALTIGIALVSTVGVVGESIKSSFLDTLERSIDADLFIVSEAGGTFPSALADELEQVDGVAVLSRFKFNQISLGTDESGEPDVAYITSFDSSTGTELVDLDVTDGSQDGLTDDGVLVHRDEAEDRDLAVGDPVELEFPADLGTAELTVTGIFDDNSFVNSPYVLDLDVYQRFLSDDDDAFVGVIVDDGTDFATVKTDVVDITDSFSGATAQDNTELTQTVEDQIDGFITLINYLLAFALFIAFLGVINTIVLSVIERTREIGLLRAVGMTQGQIRAAIRWESVIVCLFGALLGIVLGVLFAWAAVTAIPDNVIDSVAIPYETVMFAILAAALAGVVAALLPARRAAKLNVLEAIASGE